MTVKELLDCARFKFAHVEIADEVLSKYTTSHSEVDSDHLYKEVKEFEVYDNGRTIYILLEDLEHEK